MNERADAVAMDNRVRWQRWRGETAAGFRARVLADAARLGVVARFQMPSEPEPAADGEQAG